MTVLINNFHVTLSATLHIKSIKIILSAFIVKLAQPIDFNSAENWEVGISKI